MAKNLTDNWQIAEILSDNWHLYPPIQTLCIRWINCWSDRFNEYKSDWSRDRYNVELKF